MFIATLMFSHLLFYVYDPYGTWGVASIVLWSLRPCTLLMWVTMSSLQSFDLRTFPPSVIFHKTSGNLDLTPSFLAWSVCPCFRVDLWELRERIWVTSWCNNSPHRLKALLILLLYSLLNHLVLKKKNALWIFISIKLKFFEQIRARNFQSIQEFFLQKSFSVVLYKWSTLKRVEWRQVKYLKKVQVAFFKHKLC